MELIDTHAHLDDERFQNDLSDVLERGRRAGVTRVVAVATTAASSRVCLDLAVRHGSVVPSVGLQPNNLAAEPPGAWDEVVQLAADPRVVALGETGLDRHWHDTPFALQEEFFARHLELARIRALPVIIHCREAEADVVRMLRDDFDRHGAVRAVMHSFTGDLATAEACLAMGLYISFAGMVTFKNAQSLRNVAAKVPLERLMIETDSPYLAPVPLRGKRNEPAFVAHTAAHLAQVRGLSVEALAEATTRNARTLFGLEG